MTDDGGLRGREQLLEAVDELLRELRTDTGEEWENTTLAAFLEGFGALLSSIENAYLNAGEVVPSDPWTIVARVVRGARYYE